MLFLPMNQPLHWPLCHNSHPPSVNHFSGYDYITVEGPSILFLDPLDSHLRDEICHNVQLWLDTEWKKYI